MTRLLVRKRHVLAATQSVASPTYQQKIVADGASNYWRLDETSGLSAIDSIGGANGTISGGVTLNQVGAISNGKSMLFDGSTGRITLPTMSFPTNCSVEAWIKTTYVAAAEPVISNWLSISAGTYFGTNLGNLFVFGSVAANGPFVADGNWHHVVYVAQGTNTTIYVDGVAYNAGASGHITTVPVSMLIANGGGGLPNDWWHGSIDEVAIYPLILTPTQISAHYALRVTTPLTYQQKIVADGALAYWPLDETSGTVARDLAGTRNGTISGGVTLGVTGAKPGLKAMSFPGTNAVRIDLPAIPSISAGHTFEAWSLINTPGPGPAVGCILIKNDFSVGAFLFTNSFALTNQNRIGYSYPGIVNLASDPSYMLNNAWHHLVVTYDGTSFKSYIDGVFTISNTIAFPPDTTTAIPLVIGSPATAISGAIPITLQDVAVYLRALTLAEIQAHYALR